ncbi:MAG: U32 family peptidase [Erysipelotrichaceae bacterium]|nr:U32 family peptidase [Erysipelotrichaceae bacterium]
MRTELLAPAGDLDRLKTAVIYGADAVYFGGKQFSLRARASNFSLDDIKEAVEFAHSYGKRVYVTVNIIPHNSDFNGLEDYLRQLEEFNVDAIICASQAICDLCKRVAPKLEVHISTQQTTLNSYAMAYWTSKKVDRIVLGREVTYEELQEIMQIAEIPVEVFIHGGMCANFSGRCTISNVLTNRDANRGGCAQSCRWNYHLYHGDDLLDKDEYLFSLGSKDMSTPDFIERLLKVNVASLKIEGRMKTAYYIASILKGYRLLIDSYYENGKVSEEDLKKADYYLSLAANRDTFNGFYPGVPNEKGQLYNFITTASQSFIANVKNYDAETSEAIIEVRNHFEVNDELVIMNPNGDDVKFTVKEMFDEKNEPVEVANKPMQLLRIKVPVAVNEYTFIHK